ncbi:MAG TPA: SurA N-terminal domain-containing protein [Rhizomicrobium sp.]|jgi:peptidyl-prolyl cis-trans isomerase D|nr:SurA N-terminal domain-containing protein [Rhizomicrobium sp.]
MLQQMRSFSKSIVSTIFMGALALSFAVWGIADVFRGRTDTDVVTVGSTALSIDQFSREYRNFIRAESQQSGQEITTDMARKTGLADSYLEQIINRTAIDNLVEKMGLTVSDGDVSARIRAMPVFNGPLGTFDRDVFEQQLQRRGFDETEFVEGMRADMTRSQLIGPIEAAFRAPRGYAHALFAYSTELRATQYVVLGPSAIGAIAPPSDSTLLAYIKANANRFSTPEYRDVTVAAIGPEDVSAGIKISEDRLKQEYEAKKSTYVIPDKRDVQQITFSDEASAKAARDKIAAGSTFEQAAFAAKKTMDERGSVSQDDLGPLGPAVFALPVDGVTQPLKNFSSWVLLHVSKITPGKTTSFDEARPELTKELTEQMAQSKIVDAANAYTDAVSAGEDLPEAAKKAGMRVIHAPAVDSKGLAPDGSASALPADPELLAQIFNADVGESGDPFQTKLGRTYVIAVNGVTPPKLKPLDAVRAQALQAWTAERTAKLLQERAKQLAQEARKDGNLVHVAQSVGAPVLSGPALRRTRPNDTFSPALIAAVFAAKPAGIVSGPLGKGQGYVIAQVTGVAHPPLPENSPGYQNGVREIGAQIAGDITNSLAAAARAKQGVDVNRKLFDQAVGGGEGS